MWIPERYDIWTMQSAYHNLPTINGCMQKDGKSYGAANTQTLFSDSHCEIQMDIAPAYPREANLAHYIRKAVLLKGKEIQIHDSFNLSDSPSGSSLEKNVILSFMTYEKPVMEQQGDILLFHIGDKGTLCVMGGAFVNTEVIPITDQRLKAAWEHEIYRTLIAAVDRDIEISIY